MLLCYPAVDGEHQAWDLILCRFRQEFQVDAVKSRYRGTNMWHLENHT